ncbi:hypothetical protein [Pseudoalteromonas sp. JC3]|uniref:hypothetical protein n=1 Tax=Pseudoalteromonas sp. JC3 TaxID=2810196 RepID=UPI0019D2CAED|nr:hypothetical protein [Pseudoalteromonas sp. JC3]MBR8842488.1 hypothetical protein [Pseudoalteromonas sp. JC3]WJE09394.1 hypothetical protein QSH61_02680 [Pseudoalteromonas sp. JC3]
MKVIKQMQTKYKHYALIIIALIFAVYIVEPLREHIDATKSEVQVLQLRANKLEELVTQADTLSSEESVSEVEKERAKEWVFVAEAESAFKIKVQEQLEKILTASECQVERIGWEVSTQPFELVKKWNVELKFSGNPICMVKVTRALEGNKPMYILDGFAFQTRSWGGGIDNKIEASLKVSLFQQKEVG